MDEFDYQDYILLYDRLRCDDVIFHWGTFESSIGITVPIVSGHDFGICLGWAVLERDDIGVFAKCKFFDDYMGEAAKLGLTDSDDLTISCPVYRVERDGENVISGDIRCVSVIAKAKAFTYAGNKKY